MTTIDDIKKLIAKDETRTVEVKKTTGELYKGMETACAFLNSDGGWLMFGIAPSLKIIGQNVTDNTRQEVANAIRKIEPAIDVEVEYVELPDKPDNYVIAIYFDSNNFKNGPYSFDGRAFYKVESTTALMPRQMYEERLKISNPQRFSWENTPNSEITVDDIDTELLYQTLHDGIGSGNDAARPYEDYAKTWSSKKRWYDIECGKCIVWQRAFLNYTLSAKFVWLALKERIKESFVTRRFAKETFLSNTMLLWTFV